MSTLNQLKSGIARAWDSLTEGWSELVERAGEALTRFHPRSSGELQTADERLAASGSRWSLLAAEVRLDEDTVQVCIEIPGMQAEDFQIDVVEDMLVVRGEKKVERQSRQGDYQVTERAYGAFERAVRLPAPVDESGARASYKRGVLKIELPRSAAHKARRIPVRSI